MLNRYGIVLRCFPAVFLLFLASGCGEQPQIREYTVPKSAADSAPEASANSETELKPARMMAAMIPRGNRAWYFKVVGPPAAVEQEAERIKEFLASVEFPQPEEPAWTLPEDWSEAGPDGKFRYNTIEIPAGGAALEMSVIPLGIPSGKDMDEYKLENVNRWRKEVNLPEISQAEVADQLEELPTKDGTALLVDLAGTQAGPSGAMGRSGGKGRAPFLEAMAKQRQQPPERPSQATPTYELPKEWVKVATPPSRFSPVISTYQIGEDGEKAKVTVSRMVSQAGLDLANVNRWRVDELNMKSIGEDQLDETFTPIKAGDLDGRYVKLEGETQATLVGIFDVGGLTWFFKIIGDAGLVMDREAEFRTFIQSVRFSNKEAGDE